MWCGVQVLEPKDGKVIGPDWGSIGALELFDDDEQPLPQNVSGPWAGGVGLQQRAVQAVFQQPGCCWRDELRLGLWGGGNR
jgi:hypothetical protein